MRSFIDRLQIDEVRGLRPRSWICSGAGFSREELKAFVFRRGATLSKEAVTTPSDLALRILHASDLVDAGASLTVLGPLARQEALREIFENRELREALRVGFPELARLKRQRGFYKKIDRALQGGRMAFSHWDEASVYSARLEQAYGENVLRAELEQFRRGLYERRLQAEGWLDEPMLYELAMEALARGGWPALLKRPARIYHFHVHAMESLERAFWERVGEHVVIEDLRPGEDAREAEVPWTWRRWHTFDDAADALAGGIKARGAFESECILIPDEPSIRRSLVRALRDAGVPLADARDPTRIRWDEAVKAALLPLRVVAGGFARRDVLAWLKAFAEPGDETATWEKEIASRGVRRGLEAYAGGLLAGRVQPRLKRLAEALGGRSSVGEFAEAHLRELRQWAGGRAERVWVHVFFEKLWTEYAEDLRRLKRVHRKGPALHWLEHLGERLEQAKPPVEPIRAKRGVEIFRLSQAPVPHGGSQGRRLWIFGLQPGWFSGDASGDYWFSEREREVLAGEFAVRSAPQVREERLSVLRSWLCWSSEAHVLDAQYDWAGAEREGILPDLRELGGFDLKEPEDLGAHCRWVGSFGAIRPVPALEVRLPAGEATRTLDASELERYSKCAFQSLAGDRWKLRDFREPDAELWPDVKGTILHRAVELLLRSRDPASGVFGLTPEQSLAEAWDGMRLKGLLRGPRIERYVRSRLLLALETFFEKEKEYLERSKVEVFQLEPEALRLDLGEGLGEIKGRPDRIDAHPDGLFVIDYKASSSHPSGKDMIELGYRLQLPFYALASLRAYGRPVLGVQFVELTRKGGRSRGIFLKRYNGKAEGSLTNANARNASLMDVEDPDEIWSRAREQVEAHVRRIRAGNYAARPKKDEECRSCAFSDLCGKRRRLADVEETVPELALV